MQEKVQRKELRKMRVGQTRIFTLINKKKISSAKQNIYQMCQEEDLEFEVKPDYEASSISITRVK